MEKVNINMVTHFAETWEQNFVAKEYPTRDWRDLIAVTPADDGAQSIATTLTDRKGKTEWAGGGLNDSTGLVDVTGRKVTTEIRRGLAGYFISDDEIEAAANARKYNQRFPSTPDAKINAVMEAYEDTMQSLVTMGDDALGVTGLFNNPNIMSENLATPLRVLYNQSPTGGARRVYDAIANRKGKILLNSKKTRSANMLIMGIEMADWLDTLRFENTEALSVMTALLQPGRINTGRNISPLDVRSSIDIAEDRLLFQDRDPAVADVVVPYRVRFNAPRRVKNGYIRDAHFKTSAPRIKNNLGFYLVEDA